MLCLETPGPILNVYRTQEPTRAVLVIAFDIMAKTTVCTISDDGVDELLTSQRVHSCHCAMRLLTNPTVIPNPVLGLGHDRTWRCSGTQPFNSSVAPLLASTLTQSCFMMFRHQQSGNVSTTAKKIYLEKVIG
jgi:hypothetical protein